MTLRDLVGALGRQWYAPAFVLIAAFFVTIAVVQHTGLYTSSTSVTFHYPGSSDLDRYNGSSDHSVIAFAAAIAEEVAPEQSSPDYADSSAPYYGAGLRRGVFVGLPNWGTQWVASYGRAQIDVQVIGPDRDWVEAQQQKVVEQVLTLAQDRQNDVGVGLTGRLVVEEQAASRQLNWIIPDASALGMAITAIAGAALLVGGWAAVMLDRSARFGASRSRRTTRVARPERMAA